MIRKKHIIKFVVCLLALLAVFSTAIVSVNSAAFGVAVQKLYLSEDFDPESTVEEIECEHATCEVEGDMLAGTVVEITVHAFEEGYALDKVLVSCDGEAVVTQRNGNVVKFIMPDGKIKIKVLFKESVSETENVKGKLLGTKEIIAIVVAGTILLIGAGVIFFKSYKEKKKK